MWIQNSPVLNPNSNQLQLSNYEEQKLSRTLKIFSNNDTVLNCLQFINLIQYYFSDYPGFNKSASIDDSDRKQLDNGIQPIKSVFSSKSAVSDQNGSSSEHSAFNSDYVETCFPCIVCSSQFSFEQTFHLHLERRSIVIRFVF